MSRKKQAPKRIFYPDAKYNSLTLAKFINFLMYDGKKSISEKISSEAQKRKNTDGATSNRKKLSSPTKSVKKKQIINVETEAKKTNVPRKKKQKVAEDSTIKTKNN